MVLFLCADTGRTGVRSSRDSRWSLSSSRASGISGDYDKLAPHDNRSVSSSVLRFFTGRRATAGGAGSRTGTNPGSVGSAVKPKETMSEPGGRVPSSKLLPYGVLPITQQENSRRFHKSVHFDRELYPDLCGSATTSIVGQKLLGVDAMEYRPELCILQVEASKLKLMSLKASEVLIGWQVCKFCRSFTRCLHRFFKCCDVHEFTSSLLFLQIVVQRRDGTFIGMGVITGVRKNLFSRKIEHRVSSDSYFDCWLKLRHCRDQTGTDYQLLRKVPMKKAGKTKSGKEQQQEQQQVTDAKEDTNSTTKPAESATATETATGKPGNAPAHKAGKKGKMKPPLVLLIPTPIP
jgi:hypothetical protein